MKNKILLTLSGCMVGFINGFLGGGGGVLVVAILMCALKLPAKNAHATALFVILPTSVVSCVMYLVNGMVEVKSTTLTSIGVVVGGIIGAMLLSKLKGSTIKIIFSIILIASGIRMFF